MRSNPRLEDFMPVDPGAFTGWHSQPEQQQAAKSKSKSKPDPDDDDDDDDPDDDEDDDDDSDDDDEDPDDDDLGELDEDELKAELRKTRDQLSKASGSGAVKRKKIRRLEAELAEARKAKPAVKPKTKAADGDREPVDEDAIRASVKAEAKAEAAETIKKAEARGALRAAGVPAARVAKAVGLLSLEDVDVDDDGAVDGLDEAIDELKKEWPELFPKGTPRARRRVAGDKDATGKAGPRKKYTATELQVAAALGKPIRR